jgi:hypothetical protein
MGVFCLVFMGKTLGKVIGEKIMLEVEKWAQDKQPFLAAFALFIAFQAEDFFEGIEEAKEEALSVTKYPYPELKIWQKYYRSISPTLEHFSDVILGDKKLVFRMRKELNRKNLFFEFAGNEKESFLKKKVLLPADVQQKSLVVKKENAEKVYQSSLKFLTNEINGKNSEFIDALKAKITSTDESSFVYRVFIPCWYFYGKTPSQLLRKARQGDLKSLESLVRLDSSVIFEKKISSILHQLRNQAPHKHREIMECIFKRPKSRMTKQKIKCFLAGMIWIISKSINLPLTEPEIRELFDAIAQDKGQGLIDVDLPEEPHALYMAMQREMKSFFLPT